MSSDSCVIFSCFILWSRNAVDQTLFIWIFALLHCFVSRALQSYDFSRCNRRPIIRVNMFQFQVSRWHVKRNTRCNFKVNSVSSSFQSLRPHHVGRITYDDLDLHIFQMRFADDVIFEMTREIDHMFLNVLASKSRQKQTKSS